MAPSTLETKIRINIDTRDGVGNIEALNAAIKKTLQELGRSADFDALEKLRQQAADGKLNVARQGGQLVAYLCRCLAAMRVTVFGE